MGICFENSYLCYINNSTTLSKECSTVVVICSKILTFAI